MNKLYKDIYTYYLQKIKSSGLKVYHRKLKNNFAEYTANKYIVIDTELKNTLIGIVILLHEYKHHLDCKSGKYRYFYNDKLEKANFSFTQKRNYVWKVEWGCYEYARTELSKYNIDINKIKMLNKSHIKSKYLPLWLAMYKIHK